MPHSNITGENIINLEHAKIAQKNFTVLSDVNLNIKKGRFCYLIGKTGSGKSSLLKTLYGHIPLVGGHGSVVGFDLAKLRASEIPNLRRKLGIVFQDFQLLSDRTVEKNLKFVLEATGWSDKTKMDERINEVLNSVNMKSKKHKMPHELSGGEQQRIAIARALLNHPDLILADEPTGNLDPETSNEIMTLLKKVAEDSHTAVVMATHDYHMIQNFPGEAIRCEDGKVSVLDTAELFE
ncbi:MULTISPECIES: cell division ATP-binding protein FtsE [Chryseobacterium]|uniref:ATP-binding cassette domain-containing protein n=1 Tax=Chryseobacterium caseinilyticum TaxID=2771428 RepID=A0ABR8ZFW9_9FLAO|nr:MULTISPECIES: ATP-binding cassette domain-containing protein [Chryseobacterium]KQS94301.1 phosphonate ABC transporter ATP-binding protein [Chryseobacterium sp. Leaf394]MBD8083755.1 ATP-binding cassette domain-containing protein [Chryseobacterium caseinilyticum]